eukprot:366102-Chlamydomonas_euryale.AAC.1
MQHVPGYTLARKTSAVTLVRATRPQSHSRSPVTLLNATHFQSNMHATRPKPHVLAKCFQNFTQLGEVMVEARLLKLETVQHTSTPARAELSHDKSRCRSSVARIATQEMAAPATV